MVTFASSFSRVAAYLLVPLLAGSALAADWQQLTSNSPFGGNPTAAAPVSTSDPELRGALKEDDTWLVMLYDPVAKTSKWVPVEGNSGGLTVTSFDPLTNRVSITSNGRPLTLDMKRASVGLMAAPPPQPMPGNVVIRGDGNRQQRGPDGPQVRALPAEAKAMIEEIRRRRAQRQQAAQQAAATNAAPPAPAPRPNSP